MHMNIMSFEVRDRDVLGRIGKLTTKNGTITTPALMPVINPVSQSIAPMRMKREFGCEILITNSYIIKKNFGNNPDINVHGLIDFDTTGHVGHFHPHFTFPDVLQPGDYRA